MFATRFSGFSATIDADFNRRRGMAEELPFFNCRPEAQPKGLCNLPTRQDDAGAMAAEVPSLHSGQALHCVQDDQTSSVKGPTPTDEAGNPRIIRLICQKPLAVKNLNKGG